MRLCSRNFLVRLCLELWLLFWLQPLFESQGEHFSFSSFLACVFHIKLIPSECKVMVEWYCHLKQSWLCYHQFLTWVGLHPNQKLLSPTNCDWMCTCVLLTGCVSWLRDFKAVGEGTVGGPDASQLGGVHNHVLKHLSAWKEDAAHKTAPCCDLGHHEWPMIAFSWRFSPGGFSQTGRVRVHKEKKEEEFRSAVMQNLVTPIGEGPSASASKG